MFHARPRVKIQPKQAKDVVDAINRLTVSIQRDRKIDKKTLENIDDQAAAKYLQRFAAVAQQANPLTAGVLVPGQSQQQATSPETASPGDMLRTVEAASRQAPLMQRKAFAGQDLQAQKQALLQYIYSQPDIMRLRALVQQGDHTELDRRELSLRESIGRIGEIDVPDDPCDNDMLSADACVDQYTQWLEQAARNRSALSRVGGFWEDLGFVDWFHQHVDTQK